MNLSLKFMCDTFKSLEEIHGTRMMASSDQVNALFAALDQAEAAYVAMEKPTPQETGFSAAVKEIG